MIEFSQSINWLIFTAHIVLMTPIFNHLRYKICVTKLKTKGFWKLIVIVAYYRSHTCLTHGFLMNRWHSFCKPQRSARRQKHHWWKTVLIYYKISENIWMYIILLLFIIVNLLFCFSNWVASFSNILQSLKVTYIDTSDERNHKWH